MVTDIIDSKSAAATRANFEKMSKSVNTKKKQISFLSAIFIVVGSCIGSGIFLKSASVLENSWYSLPLAISTWVISAIAVIAMLLALVEVTSKCDSNLSVIGWVKTFNKKFLYKACKNFMFYAYTPLTFFYMPLYVLQTLQDALTGFGVNNNFGTSADFLIWSCFGILISAWFIFTSGYSTKFGNVQNWIITLVKFFPLVIITILGYYISASHASNESLNISPTNPETITTFTELSPGIGMFISFGAIFFAFDGFYYSSGIKTEMKEPQKAPLALILGIIVTTIIYLLISIAMSVAYPNDGSFNSFSDFLRSKGLSWLFSVVNIMIAVGILGIINGIAMWATRFSEDLIKSGELPWFYKCNKRLNSHCPKIGIMYTAITALIVFVVFALIGGLAYVPYGYTTEGISNYDASGYDSMARLLAFADLMGNWTSIIVFGFIVAAIISCLINRKTNRIEVTKSKFFVPAAIISTIIVGLGLIFQFIAPFANLLMLIDSGVRNALSNPNQDIISRVMTVVVFFIFILIMVLPSLGDYDSFIMQKKYVFKVTKNRWGLDEVILVNKRIKSRF